MHARRILVPLDGSEMAEAALPVAENLTRGADTTFVLVRAAEAPPTLADIVAARLDAIEAAARYLESVAADLRERGFSNVEIVPLYGPAGAVILEAARSYEADLIVMATSGRSGVRRFIHGSVAETVVRGTQTPVFLVRAGNTAGRSAQRREVSLEKEWVRV
jgi:nucleotide-binding universal stress UspA family protein